MEDNELIKKCKQGEEEAFHQLIIKYHPYVYKFLCRISEDEILAEDLTQETFINIIRNINKFDIKGKAKFSTYLLTISKNCYIDHYRREKKRNGDVPIDHINDVYNDQRNIEDVIEDKLLTEAILENMSNLSMEQQMVIRMKYIEDLTLKEIGDQLQLEAKTVKSRIHNGMVKLRKMMQGGD